MDIASNANEILSNLSTDMSELQKETNDLTTTIEGEIESETACKSGPLMDICTDIKDQLDADLNLDYDPNKVRLLTRNLFIYFIYCYLKYFLSSKYKKNMFT